MHDEDSLSTPKKDGGASDTTGAKRSKNDRDLYLEAIYREDSSGKIFMKYLMSKNKIVRKFCFLIIINKAIMKQLFIN